MATLNINGKALDANADPSTPLLWVIRDTLGMTGTKFGCGAALCGACTVLLDGKPIRSCSTPMSASLGFGFFCSSAVALMIWPAWQ